MSKDRGPRRDVLVQILEISTRRLAGYGVVAVRGELDVAGAPDLRTALRTACRDGEDMVILDLAELTFTDSSGLSILVEYHAKTKAAGGAMILTGIQPFVARVLGITGLDRELRIAARPDDAAATLQQIEREPREGAGV
jgi:anti-sigma B factor antagonist